MLQVAPLQFGLQSHPEQSSFCVPCVQVNPQNSQSDPEVQELVQLQELQVCLFETTPFGT